MEQKQQNTFRQTKTPKATAQNSTRTNAKTNKQYGQKKQFNKTNNFKKPSNKAKRTNTPKKKIFPLSKEVKTNANKMKEATKLDLIKLFKPEYVRKINYAFTKFTFNDLVEMAKGKTIEEIERLIKIITIEELKKIPADKLKAIAIYGDIDRIEQLNKFINDISVIHFIKQKSVDELSEKEFYTRPLSDMVYIILSNVADSLTKHTPPIQAQAPATSKTSDKTLEDKQKAKEKAKDKAVKRSQMANKSKK